jgi:hypothetical protein
MAASKKRFAPKPSHFVSYNEAISTPSISLYGKLIQGGEAQPSDLALSHPSDPGEPLHRSLVVGYANGTACQTLVQPQQVFLPRPDGPADGCGWDPNDYVVWKNVRPDWTTVHVTTAKRTLSAVLATGRVRQFAAFERPQISAATGDPVVNVVKKWAKLTRDPDLDEVLSNLYFASGGTTWSDGQTSLAGLLHQDLGVTISPTAITQTMQILDLMQLIG